MFDLTIVLVLLGAAILMFAINRPRLDVVALIMLLRASLHRCPHHGVKHWQVSAIQTLF